MRIDRILIFFSLLGAFYSLGQCGETGYLHLDYDGVPDVFQADNSNHIIAAVRVENSTTLVKLDDARHVLQELDMGDINSAARVYDMAIDSNDNIYLCGVFSSNIYLGPGHYYSGPGGFVAKLNPSFGVEWVHISQDGFPRALSFNSNNGLYVSYTAGSDFMLQGQTFSAIPFTTNLWLLKLNASDGLFQWSKQRRTDGYNTNTCYLETSNDEGVYEVINFDEYLWDEFGVEYDATGLVYGDLNAMIAYYDEQGNRIWIKRMIHGEPMAINKTQDGNLALYCQMDDFLSVESDTIYSYFRKSSGYLEYDISGELIQKNRIITTALPNYLLSERCGIACLPDGGFVVSGRSRQELNFDGLIRPRTDLDQYDNTFFVANYDSIGTVRWARTFGKGDGQVDLGVRVMNDCSVYFLGYAYANFLFDANNADTIAFSFIPFLIEFDLETGILATDTSLNGGGNSTDDPFGPNGTPGSNVGLNELTDQNLFVYPNPVSSVLTVKTQETTYFKWELLNEVGQKMFDGANYGTSSIDMQDLPSGLYLLKISNDQYSLIRKISKY